MTEPAKKQRGRPPMPAEQRHTERVEIRLSLAQREKLDRLGGASWVRKKIDLAREKS